MAGIKKGSKCWYQMMIGRLVNDLSKIHENYPEADEELKKLTKDLGHYVDNTIPLEHDEPVRSIADIFVKKVFD